MGKRKRARWGLVIYIFLEEKQTHMSTLMSIARKQDLAKFKEMLPNATAKHVDQSLMVVVRDTTPTDEADPESENGASLTMFKMLLKHPNVSDRGIKSAFDAAIMNKQRTMLKLFLRDRRIRSDDIISHLLD